MVDLAIGQRRTPVFGGHAFGAAGPYEMLTGVVSGALDPAAPGNAGIVGLADAARGGDGRVPWRADIAILKPVETARGNGWLFADIPNRGYARAPARVMGSTLLSPHDARLDPGNGLLMDAGFSIVWVGWQAELPPGNGALIAEYPALQANGAPLVGPSREEWTDTGTAPTFRVPLTYPAADPDPAAATLTVRALADDPRSSPPDLAWRYVGDSAIEIDRPAGTDSGAIYEFIYPATDAAVSGIAFAAMRDVASWLRFDGDAANPLTVGGEPALRHALLFGVSQSGRFVRDFLYQGFNADTAGRAVFDAALPVVAGSRKTFVNAAFAQPGRYPRQHEDHDFPGDQFPFAYSAAADPAGGGTDDLLGACRAAGAVPKVMHFDTESEMWVARASLLSGDGSADYAPDPDVRLYLAAGIQHSVTEPPPAGMAALTVNPLDYTTLVRPLVGALVRWVEDGVAPPPSRFPLLGDGTLVPLADYRAAFPQIPGVPVPDRINELARNDHTTLPPTPGAAYRVLVPACDADGNAIAGVRHPFVDVPLGTFTGWNIRGLGHGAGDLCTVMGGFVPFAVDEAARKAAGDPRPSLAERYGDHAGYLARLRGAVEGQVDAGYLLTADAAAALDRAAALAPVFAGQARAEDIIV